MNYRERTAEETRDYVTGVLRTRARQRLRRTSWAVFVALLFNIAGVFLAIAMASAALGLPWASVAWPGDAFAYSLRGLFFLMAIALVAGPLSIMFQVLDMWRGALEDYRLYGRK
jgi:hypothetical protein